MKSIQDFVKQYPGDREALVDALVCEVRRLQDALEPFATVAMGYEFQKQYADDQFPVNLGIMNGNVTQSVVRDKLKIEDFRNAARALN